MTYQQFAYLYDELMQDAPYDKWVEIIKKYTEKNEVQGSRLLDLACGTGELSIRLAKDGFDVTGVDLSDDMLAVANSKAGALGADIQFYQQNMAELEGLGQFDVIGIFCDSLNYLQTETEVINTFRSVHQHLANDGLFMFDVHSIYKMQHIFMNETFTLNEDEISYIWQCFEGEYPYSIEHDLSFFVLDERSGKYDRYDELHVQRTYPIDVYQTWLVEAGFDLIDIVADFEALAPQSQSERIFFICKKQT